MQLLYPQLTEQQVEDTIFELCTFKDGKVIEVRYVYLQILLITGYIPERLEQSVSAFISLGKELRFKNWKTRNLPKMPINDFCEYNYFININ